MSRTKLFHKGTPHHHRLACGTEGPLPQGTPESRLTRRPVSDVGGSKG